MKEKKKRQRARKKERRKGGKEQQRPTCLKSMKASSSVSPWKPGTGPALANPVGKRGGEREQPIGHGAGDWQTDDSQDKGRTGGGSEGGWGGGGGALGRGGGAGAFLEVSVWDGGACRELGAGRKIGEGGREGGGFRGSPLAGVSLHLSGFATRGFVKSIRKKGPKE